MTYNDYIQTSFDCEICTVVFLDIAILYPIGVFFFEC